MPARFCPFCGASLEGISAAFCPRCGRQLPDVTPTKFVPVEVAPHVTPAPGAAPPGARPASVPTAPIRDSTTSAPAPVGAAPLPAYPPAARAQAYAPPSTLPAAVASTPSSEPRVSVAAPAFVPNTNKAIKTATKADTRILRIALVFIITAACAALPGASKSRLDDAFYAVFNFAFFSPFVLVSVFWLASRLLPRQRFGAVLAQALLASAALLLVMPIIRASELALFAGAQSDRFAWLGRLRTHPTLLLWGIAFTVACALLGSLLALLLVRWAASQSQDTKENPFLAYLMPLAGSLGLFVVLYAVALGVPAFAHIVGAGLRWMTATAILIALIACLLYVRELRRSA